MYVFYDGAAEMNVESEEENRFLSLDICRRYLLVVDADVNS